MYILIEDIVVSCTCKVEILVSRKIIDFEGGLRFRVLGLRVLPP